LAAELVFDQTDATSSDLARQSLKASVQTRRTANCDAPSARLFLERREQPGSGIKAANQPGGAIAFNQRFTSDAVSEAVGRARECERNRRAGSTRGGQSGATATSMGPECQAPHNHRDAWRRSAAVSPAGRGHGTWAAGGAA